MLRDKIQTENYFEQYIQNTINRKSNYIEKIERLDNPKQGYVNSAATLDLFTRNLILSKFSLGCEIKDIIEDYKESLYWFGLIYNSKSFYVQLLWMISMGIMLEIEQKEFNKILELVREDNPEDFLIDFLLKHNSRWGEQHSEFKFPIPYKPLSEVINLSLNHNKTQAIEHLQIYLQKEWYKGHSDSGWYDNHKSKHNTYAGYWSWESGAIVKILGLDDRSLKNQQYYPYDMVHWKDDKSTSKNSWTLLD